MPITIETTKDQRERIKLGEIDQVFNEVIKNEKGDVKN